MAWLWGKALYRKTETKFEEVLDVSHVGRPRGISNTGSNGICMVEGHRAMGPWHYYFDSGQLEGGGNYEPYEMISAFGLVCRAKAHCLMVS